MKNGALLDAFRHKGEAIVPKGAQPHTRVRTMIYDQNKGTIMGIFVAVVGCK
jgi:hypothetical protein